MPDGSSGPNTGIGTPMPLMPYPLPGSIVNGTMSPQGIPTPGLPSPFASEATQAAGGQTASAYDTSSTNQATCSTCAYTYVSDTDHTIQPIPGDMFNPCGCGSCPV